jgi:hypothetical protein
MSFAREHLLFTMWYLKEQISFARTRIAIS